MVKLSRKWKLILVILALAAVGGYILAAYRYYRTGFPLDDAWIHQTYARNLAELGEWSFVPGQPSAGSTAPLWSLLLAAGYALPGLALPWAYLLGAASLVGTVVLGEIVFRKGNPGLKTQLPLAGMFLALEWHLVWASVSGMETALQGLLILVGFALLMAALEKKSTGLFAAAGAAAGLSGWIRPDGVTLLGPALFCAFLLGGGMKSRLGRLGAVLGGFAALFIPYLLVNQSLAGSLWPNTFYAKQAEYAVQLELPLLDRITSIFSLPMIGAGLLLAPGVLYFTWQAGRKREPLALAMILWWAGFSLLYVLRLPVIYQHGRYLMPAMPVFWLMGLWGTAAGLAGLRVTAKWRRRLTAFFVVLIAAVNVSFYGLGASTYAGDVAIIESEMVDTAKWIQQNTEPDALIAAHDIGALGYFGQRDLVDLAGLVSPEVTPFIRDEAKLGEFVTRVGADYLMTFPGWYPELSQKGERIYASQARFAQDQGGENMAVYRWPGKK